jgi:hypothetical protein
LQRPALRRAFGAVPDEERSRLLFGSGRSARVESRT